MSEANCPKLFDWDDAIWTCQLVLFSRLLWELARLNDPRARLCLSILEEPKFEMNSWASSKNKQHARSYFELSFSSSQHIDPILQFFCLALFGFPVAFTHGIGRHSINQFSLLPAFELRYDALYHVQTVAWRQNAGYAWTLLIVFTSYVYCKLVLAWVVVFAKSIE